MLKGTVRGPWRIGTLALLVGSVFLGDDVVGHAQMMIPPLPPRPRTTSTGPSVIVPGTYVQAPRATTYGGYTYGTPTYGATTYGGYTYGTPTYGATTYGGYTYGGNTYARPVYGYAPSSYINTVPPANYAPSYGYATSTNVGGATIAGYRYLDDYATGRGLPLAKPWMRPLR